MENLSFVNVFGNPLLIFCNIFLTYDRDGCIMTIVIKRFDRFTRPRRQGSHQRLSFSQENSRGCFIYGICQRSTMHGAIR